MHNETNLTSFHSRWEEEKLEDGTKWKFLEHKGPLFAPQYENLPKNVLFEYDGKKMHLSPEAEEIAGFYSKMLDHDYTSKKVFNDNFFKVCLFIKKNGFQSINGRNFLGLAQINDQGGAENHHRFKQVQL